MFTFKKYEECLQADIPQGYIKPDIRNDFYYSVNVKELDELFFVRFTPQSIHFIFDSYNDNREETNNRVETQGETVVASISLTNRKDTGHDILNFAKHINVKILKDFKLSKELVKCLEVLCDIYEAFPFAAKLKKHLKKKEKFDSEKEIAQEEWEAFFKFCLLEFVDAVDTHAEIFSIYPDFDTVRDKLRESNVYRLLNAKLTYYAYRYKGRQPKSSREFSYLVRIYSDLLMDSDFNKIVPPTYYDGKGLFENPEVELSNIMNKSRCLYYKESKNEIENNTAKKIQSFFFTKHAVVSAMISKRSYWLCVMAQIMMLLFSAATILAMIYFTDSESCVANWFFDGFPAVAALLVVIFLVLILWGVKSRSINVFMPRITVAVAMMWLTIFVSEDLLKSQLQIKMGAELLSLSVIVLLIIVMLLLAEILQHSPYNKPHHHRFCVNCFSLFRKLFPILNYTIFITLFLGLLMQKLFYADLLKSSNALFEITFAEYFHDVEKYRQRLELLEKSLMDYRDYQISQAFSQTVAKGDNIGNVRLWPVGDSSCKIQYRGYISQKVMLSSTHEGNDVDIIGNKLRESICDRIVRLDSLMNRDNSMDDALWSCMDQVLDSLRQMRVLDSVKQKEVLDSVKKKKMVSDSVNQKIDVLLSLLSEENQRIKDFVLTYNDHDTLLKWATFDTANSDSLVLTESAYLSKLTEETKKESKLCREATVLKTMVFPSLLIIHSLIVLVLAFVAQLLLSEKTVTEPL